MTVIRPLELHQCFAPDRPVLVNQQILEHGPSLEAAPSRDGCPGNTQLQGSEDAGRDVSVTGLGTAGGGSCASGGTAVNSGRSGKASSCTPSSGAKASLLYAVQRRHGRSPAEKSPESALAADRGRRTSRWART